MIPNITRRSKQTERWKPRKRTAARYSDVHEFVTRHAFRRVRRLSTFPIFNAFSDLVELVTGHAIRVASEMLVAGRTDLTNRDGYQALAKETIRRVSLCRSAEAGHLNLSPAITKAILAVVWAWLRIQFPILNTTTAVMAAGALADLLTTRRRRIE